jgi:hypothetical protein
LAEIYQSESDQYIDHFSILDIGLQRIGFPSERDEGRKANWLLITHLPVLIAIVINECASTITIT